MTIEVEAAKPSAGRASPEQTTRRTVAAGDLRRRDCRRGGYRYTIPLPHPRCSRKCCNELNCQKRRIYAVIAAKTLIGGPAHPSVTLRRSTGSARPRFSLVNDYICLLYTSDAADERS